MCTHHVIHPIVEYVPTTLIVLVVVAIAWEVRAPTPRPGIRFMASWCALLTFVLGFSGAGSWLDFYRTAIGGSVMLIGALLVELILNEPPTGAETRGELPRARIVS